MADAANRTLFSIKQQGLAGVLSHQHVHGPSGQQELLSALHVQSPSPSAAVLSLHRYAQPLYANIASVRAQMLQEILLRSQVNRCLEDHIRLQQFEILKSQIRVSSESSAQAPSLPCCEVLSAADRHENPSVDTLGRENEIEPPVKRVKSSTAAKLKPSCKAEKDRAKDPSSRSTPVRKNKDDRWLASLKKLKVYKEKFGDCIVPRGYSQDPQLASWVTEQRKQFKLLQVGKQSSITPERVALLQELDFSWNAQESAWSKHLEDLKEFRAQHGHCHVPLAHPQYPKLGLWTKEQRRHFTLLKQGKPSHMTLERVKELDGVGFCWDTHEASWLERFRELVAFKEQHGHCLVPTNYSENPKLGTWIHHQRRQYKKRKEGKACHITEDRIRALNRIGFVWSTRGDKVGSTDSVASDTDDDEMNSTVSVEPVSRKRKRRGV